MRFWLTVSAATRKNIDYSYFVGHCCCCCLFIYSMDACDLFRFVFLIWSYDWCLTAYRMLVASMDIAFVDEVSPIEKSLTNCRDIRPSEKYRLRHDMSEHTAFFLHTKYIHMLNCNFTSNGFSFSITRSLVYMTFGRSDSTFIHIKQCM